MTTPKALKDLYVALGGEASDVADASTSVEVLNAIAAKFGGADDAVLNPSAIENIAAVAGSIGRGGGGGELNIANISINYTGSNSIALYFPAYFPEHHSIQGFLSFDTEESAYEGATIIPQNGELLVGASFPQFTNNNTEVTGNARVEYGGLVITGDCNITIKNV